MKKIILFILFTLLIFPQAAFSSDNFIYSINVGKNDDTNNVVLNVKSDYKTRIKDKIDENGRKYFDIKDASLKENFSVLYNNVGGVESVIAQQIGNKVRIYLKGSGIKDVEVKFNNVENQPYPDKSAGYALLVFGLIMFGISKLFKTKTKKTANKSYAIQNHNSKQVYKDLMEKKNSNIIHDKSKLTLNLLNKRQNDIVKSQMSGKMNIKSLYDYQKQNRINSKIAM